jgi:hypothetical protein
VVSESDNVKDTCRRKLGQAEPVENARPVPYVQIPLRLLTLPTGERSAAIEVWAALHHHLRLGSKPERITDEELAMVPWLFERSAEHGRKGLEILERLGLISREAKGSSRRVAISARLRATGRPEKPLGTEKTAEKPAISARDHVADVNKMVDKESCRTIRNSRIVAPTTPLVTEEEIEATMRKFFPKLYPGFPQPGN